MIYALKDQSDEIDSLRKNSYNNESPCRKRFHHAAAFLNTPP